jgi:hypothetical protein
MLSPLAARVAMRRREFISVLGGAAATWSFAVRAQQPERIRRVSILLPATADDAEFQTWIAAFHQAMALLGWNIGRNLRVDTRWATSNAADIRRHASELAASAPDVILAHGAATLAPLLQVTRTVPTVFVVVTDPAQCDLFEQLQPFCANAVFEIHETGGITVRPRQALDEASADCLRSSRPQRSRLALRSTLLTCAMPVRSRAPSRRSRARRTAD